MSALKDAMQAYGDWDGKAETTETSITGFFDGMLASAEFTDMVRDFLHIIDQRIASKIAPRAITLEDAGSTARSPLARACCMILTRLIK